MIIVISGAFFIILMLRQENTDDDYESLYIIQVRTGGAEQVRSLALGVDSSFSYRSERFARHPCLI